MSDPDIPRDPPRFIGTYQLASMAAGAMAVSVVGMLRLLMGVPEQRAPNLPETVFGLTAMAMYLLLKHGSGRRLYVGPLVMGAIFGPIAGAWLATSAHLNAGIKDTSMYGHTVVVWFAMGLGLGVFVALLLTPIAAAARGWVKGPFDRALFPTACIVVVAGVPVTVVDTFWGEAPWRESYLLLVLGAVGLFYFAVRALRPRASAPAAPPAGPFRSVEAVADVAPPRMRAWLALVLGAAALAPIPFAYRARAYRVEHSEKRPSKMPEPVAGLDRNVKNLRVVGSVGCAQKPNNTVVCWGNDAGPILGASWRAARTPTTREGLGPVDRFAIEGDRMCVLPKIGGRVVCWEAPDKPASMGPTGAVDLALDHGTTYALTKDGEVWTWGVSSILPATRVAGLPHANVLRVADRRACVIADPGDVYCWHSSGPSENDLPKKLADQPGPADRLELSAAALVLRSNGAWWQWSTHVPPNELSPKRIADDARLTDVLFGWGSGCYRYEDASLVCQSSYSGSPFVSLPPGSVDEVAGVDWIICARGPAGVSCWSEY